MKLSDQRRQSRTLARFQEIPTASLHPTCTSPAGSAPGGKRFEKLEDDIDELEIEAQNLQDEMAALEAELARSQSEDPSKTTTLIEAFKKREKEVGLFFASVCVFVRLCDTLPDLFTNHLQFNLSC